MSDLLQRTKNFDAWYAQRHHQAPMLPSVMF
jgi:hypothetical protein